jgi:SAM-dependent methyltransferase
MNSPKKPSLPVHEEEIAKAWNANAANWVPWVAAGKDILRNVVDMPIFSQEFLPDLRGRKIIDMGCGEGRSSRMLARKGAHVTGVDISSGMIEAATAIESARRHGIRYLCTSYTSLTEIGDCEFDDAASIMAFMDGPSFEQACREAFRIIKPGGCFYFSTLHPCFWTAGSRWAVSDKKVVGRLVVNYWHDKRYWDGVRASGPENEPLKIPRFPYRLEQYVNALCSAGFMITRMMEPRATDEMVARAPDYLARFREHTPNQLYVAARRPLA